MSAAQEKDKSVLDQLDAAMPVQLAQFDAFPKLPSTYKSRSESRGFLTLFVICVAFLLVLNDLTEYIWGWPDYEFSVDTQGQSYMNVNVDMVVNTPCQYLSVDLRDVVGDRLYLSKGFRRDGTTFDIGQATTLREHARALSARQAIAQSRNSRGFFSWFQRAEPDYRPTYNHQPNGDACRIYGTLGVKKVTANLHITALGHGYTSNVHVPHDKLNLSHVITEFSFGPYFPDITQPLDYSFELARDPFMAYQYYLHVVPTTYVAPRSSPLHTNQYSVTHYTRKLNDDGTPGIYFKFDLDPMVITIHQRTTTFIQLLIRCVGVIGGVFTCTSYFLRLTVKTFEAVSGADSTPGIVAAESTAIKRKWTGGHLRARSTANANAGRVVRQGNGWVVEGAATPYSSTPVSGSFGPTSPYPYSPYSATTPSFPPPPLASATSTTFSVPPTPSVSGSGAGAGVGLGLGAPTFSHSRTPSLMSGHSHSRTPSVSGPPPRTPSLMAGGGHGRTPSTLRNVSGDGVGPASVPLPASPFPGAGAGFGAGGVSVPPTPRIGVTPPPPPRSAKKDD